MAGTATAATYKRYTVDLSNRSITSPETREQVWQLLRELAKVIDNANAAADHQLLSLCLTLPTAEGHQGHLEEEAHEAGVRVGIEDDEFRFVRNQWRAGQRASGISPRSFPACRKDRAAAESGCLSSRELAEPVPA